MMPMTCLTTDRKAPKYRQLITGPMTCRKADRKALQSSATNLPMSNEDTNVEDVAQNGSITEAIEDLEQFVDEQLEELPSPDEAELGELCREPHIGDVDTAEGQARRAEEAADLKPPEGTEGSVQFQDCELIGDEVPDLDAVLNLDKPKGASDEEVREAVEKAEGGILEQIESEVEALEGGDN